MTLKDTLSKLSTTDPSGEDAKAERERLIGIFKEAISALYNKVESFLEEYTASGGLRITKGTTVVEEEHFGRYHAPTMTIFAGSLAVMLVPAGLAVIGARGRIDMSRQGRPAEDDQIWLLRAAAGTGGEEQWAITMPPPPGTHIGGPRFRPGAFGPPTRITKELTKQTFELCLDHLLKL